MSNNSVILGGPDAIKVWIKGDIVCSIEYVNGLESLCFWRRERTRGNGAMIIGVNVLGRYFEGQTSLPTQYCLSCCKAGVELMGFSPFDTFAVRRLIDALYEGVTELLATKPKEATPFNFDGVERLELKADGETVFKLD